MNPWAAITSKTFEAFLHCQTKAYLLLEGATGVRSDFQEWQDTLASVYKKEAFERLRASLREGDYFVGTPSLDNLRRGIYPFIFDPLISARGIDVRLHALQRLPVARDAPNLVYAPLRLLPNKTPTTTDKLLLGLDAIAISTRTGITPGTGHFIHGSGFARRAVSLPKLIERAEIILRRINGRQVIAAAPPLVLNSHCPKCEFQSRCRKVAIEKDDLSLLPNMSEEERKRHAARGIFTVTQLSYTYRPRRPSVRYSNKPPKHVCALKALAIRKNRIHVVGNPTFAIPSSAVYLDVEGTPDDDSYYLIGLRYRDGDRDIQRSFWADTRADEYKIWTSFLRVLVTFEAPRLIHYGSYEAVFLKRMKSRYCRSEKEIGLVDVLLSSSINLLSYTYAKIYFPTYSNGLKEISKYIGFRWTDAAASGLSSLVWRASWETSGSDHAKQKLLTYNAEDCEAVQKVAELIAIVSGEQSSMSPKSFSVNVDGIERDYPQRFGPLRYALPEFKPINQAAYWDYQRSRVYARSNKRINASTHSKSKPHRARTMRLSKVIQVAEVRPECCRKCHSKRVYKNGYYGCVIYDLRFSSTGVKRWVTKLKFASYTCWNCKCRHNEIPRQERYGSALRSYIMYQLVELRMSQRAITRNLDTIFNLRVSSSAMGRIKGVLAEQYEPIYQGILARVLRGKCIHVDETKVKMRGGSGYVWAFTSREDVAYVFSESREAATPKNMLRSFEGVLVTDFYTAYDSIECSQQRCLIHLLRDINEDVLKNPFNEEMERLAHAFASLLRPIIDTIDRFGLKKHFLRKHERAVERFYRALVKDEYRTDVGIGYKKRFEKNRERLFTFLRHDGVPWNNNNAEHAIKAFAELRGGIGPNGTPKSIREYLVLVSICETCKYRGLGFLGFLRSGKADFEAFAERS